MIDPESTSRPIKYCKKADQATSLFKYTPGDPTTALPENFVCRHANIEDRIVFCELDELKCPIFNEFLVDLGLKKKK